MGFHHDIIHRAPTERIHLRRRNRLRPSPNGATVPSQGRKPLDRTHRSVKPRRGGSTIMPQSFASLPCHIVFSTKNREPWIHQDLAARLYPYIGGILREEKMA